MHKDRHLIYTKQYNAQKAIASPKSSETPHKKTCDRYSSTSKNTSQAPLTSNTTILFNKNCFKGKYLLIVTSE